MKKAVPETVFFASWLTAGSAIDRIFNDWRACVIFVFAFIFLIAAAMVLAGGEEEKSADSNYDNSRRADRSRPADGRAQYEHSHKADREARRGA